MQELGAPLHAPHQNRRHNFERRPFAYTAINGGYWFVSFVVMGAILGAWR